MEEKQSAQGREVVQHDEAELCIKTEPPKLRVKPKPDAPMTIMPPTAVLGAKS
jgi:hypothetical protein